MKLDIITIFPEFFSVLDVSLIGQARRRGILDVTVHDLRDHTHDRHRTVDDTPYGGGAGMVMRPEPWGEALDAVLAAAPPGAPAPPVLVVPTPAGRRFDQRLAHELAGEDHLVFACGRYEGIDERVLDWAGTVTRLLPVSLGDYVLNGGEVAVTAMIEAVARLLPGVVGNPESLVEESHESGLLEYPLYTKPPVWRGRDIPEVLTSGHHGRVATWRRLQRVLRTAERRPDLLARFPARELTDQERRELTDRGWDCAGDWPTPPTV